MIRPIDVEPLTKDTLVLLETDYPNQCDATPSILIRDPDQWVVVNKFCFFSGGPINTEEDVYYQADFDGNPIYMLAFLSPSLTPEELYKLTDVGTEHEPGLKSIADVQEVESVYDLTERDFDDLKLYHLGPCRALPQYILQPSAWTKVLPPHFLAARQQAMLRAQDYNADHYREQVADQHNDVYDQGLLPIGESNQIHAPSAVPGIAEHPFVEAREASAFEEETMNLTAGQTTFVREAEEEGAFHSMHSGENHAFVINQGESSVPVDLSDQLGDRPFEEEEPTIAGFSRMDPPDDEPPSLKIGSMEENQHASPRYGTDRHKNDASSPSIKPDIDEHGFFTLDPRLNHDQNNIVEEEDSCNQYVSPVSESLNNQDRQFDSAENEETPQGFRSPGGNLYFEDEGMLPSNRHTQEPFQSTNYIDEYQDAAGVGMNHVEGPPRVEDGFEESHEIDDTTEVYQQDMERTSINNNELPYDSRFIDSDLPQVLSNANEEKPIQIGKDPVGSDLINSGDVCEEDPEISCASDKPGDEFVDPIDTSFSRQDELDNSALASTSSPAGMSTNSGVDTRNHQSPAMRGAHAILKRNRRRRAESNRSSTGKVSNNNTMISPAMSEKLTSTKSDTSKDMWDENGTDITGSGVSVSSGVTDKSSRRQLILQMAKARMKNNRDSPSKSPSGINEDDDGANTIVTEGNATFATHDFDLTGDLD
ncbi:unnamed protein product [Pseudo-nitzschia multistriata]|uniref:Uncharacterized protein n=1 Tax=Pseudo-nitzschia multistriata TaxID=183589 RepID=A0A448ZAS7_9STRA|nr:unnamed protein product [Pseudo-nitzschia multistriata]